MPSGHQKYKKSNLKRIKSAVSGGQLKHLLGYRTRRSTATAMYNREKKIAIFLYEEGVTLLQRQDMAKLGA